ncbi:MAG: hypothetical protein HYU63_09325 [Armatimonadetes bacterium]|nr:hypothetical protein [Armatimonadota bacterium]
MIKKIFFLALISILSTETSWAFKLPAGTIPQKITVRLTGKHIPLKLLKEAIFFEINKNIKLNKGAYYLINNFKSLNKIKAPMPGEKKNLFIFVRLAGKKYIPLEGKINLIIFNEILPESEEKFLIISNNPESINKRGKIFEENLKDFSAHRFLFHHKNASFTANCSVSLNLINPGKNKTALYFISGISAPMISELGAGHLAAVRYLSYWHLKIGRIIEIAPGKQFTVFSIKLAPQEILSGIIRFQVLEGDLPKITLSANNCFSRPQEKIVIANNSLRPQGVFPFPQIVQNYRHFIGNSYTFMVVGDEPFLKEISTKMPCYGNFGVYYKINLDIENPFDVPKTSILYFVPRSGPARATILFEEEIIETPTIMNAEEIFIKAFIVDPKKIKHISLLIFPESGSNYPVHLVVKSSLK